MPEGFTGTVPPPPPPPPVVVCTVTVAEAALVGSARLVAITVSVAALVGAVYKPEALMLPVPAVHVTDVLLLPFTVALNWTKPWVCTTALPGARLTLTGTGVVEGFTTTETEAFESG